MEAPEYFHNSFCTQFTAENRQYSLDNIIKSNGGGGGSDNLMVEVEAYLDIPNDDIVDDGNIFDTLTGISNSTDSSTVTNVIDSSCNSSSFSGSEPLVVATDTACPNFAEGPFSTVFQDPYVNDGLAGLEFIVEDRFSSEEIEQMQFISGMKAQTDEAASETRQFQPSTNQNNNNPIFNRVVPAKARSKRSRAAPCNWTSHLLLVPPTTPKQEPADVVVSEEAAAPPPPSTVGKKTLKAAAPKKKEATPEGAAGSGPAGDGRKCLHCATEKTPQWRTGPMGPKTLCNACGVRYKSGRLVPEYRPAASPTFMLTKHSNSHRKVLELRRQKEMMRAQQQFLHHQQPQHHHHHHHHPNMVFDVSNGGDYLIHQHVGPDFRQLI